MYGAPEDLHLLIGGQGQRGIRDSIMGLFNALERRSLPGGISGSMSKNSWIFAAAPANSCSSSLRIFHIAGDDLDDRRQWAVEPLAAAEALHLIWG